MALGYLVNTMRIFGTSRKVFIALIFIIIAEPAEADEVECLATNIYYEARNQSFEGMYAVAEVTLNRVKSKRWPNDICNVVQQRIVVDKKWVCQFSWYCDGKSDTPREYNRYKLCHMIAYMAIYEKDLSFLPPDTYWYHSNMVRPYWVDAYHRNAVIGDHIFYSDKF